MSVEKERQVRHEQGLEKDAAAAEDRFEHQVESSDTVTDSDDGSQSGQQQNPRKQKPGKDEPAEARIDLTA